MSKHITKVKIITESLPGAGLNKSIIDAAKLSYEEICPVEVIHNGVHHVTEPEDLSSLIDAVKHRNINV